MNWNTIKINKIRGFSKPKDIYSKPESDHLRKL